MQNIFNFVYWKKIQKAAYVHYDKKLAVIGVFTSFTKAYIKNTIHKTSKKNSKIIYYV